MAEADARFPAPSKRTASAGPAGLDVHSMIGFVRVGAPVASPTGDKVAWAARRWCADRKKWGSSICLFDLAAWEAAGAEPNRAPDFTVQLTRIAPGVSDSSPVFSPDGVSLAFSSNRSGSSQVWVLPTLNGPGEAVQLTDFPLDVSDVRWGAGDRLFFACAVFPSLTIEATAAKDKELEELKKTGGVNAMSFTSLPVRHWDSWCDSKRNHIFMAAIEREDGAWRVGAPTDLLAGLATDCPLKPFGGSEDYSVSPDGTSVVYCCRPPADQANDQAWSTNSNLYLHLLCGDAPNPLDTPRRRSGPSSPTACSDDEDLEDVPSSPAFKASPGGAANVHQVSGRLPHHVAGCLTMGNDGYDLHPVYSPCGQQIAYLSMATAGYEVRTCMHITSLNPWCTLRGQRVDSPLFCVRRRTRKKSKSLTCVQEAGVRLLVAGMRRSSRSAGPRTAKSFSARPNIVDGSRCIQSTSTMLPRARKQSPRRLLRSTPLAASHLSPGAGWSSRNRRSVHQQRCSRASPMALLFVRCHLPMRPS